MRTACPICNIASAVSLGPEADVPQLQNRVWATAEQARAAPKGKLNMLACEVCGFAWNAAFDISLNLYDPAYDNDQTHSPHFRAHIATVIQKILRSLPRDHSIHLVEAGCGQGGFLVQLARSTGNHFSSLTGFDPAWRGDTSYGVQIHDRYFGTDSLKILNGPIEAIVSRHTIEHVPDPLQFLRDMRACMSETSDARLFLETPDIEWILENFQIHDLFYEHCSLFSPRSIERALLATGFEPLCIERIFGEQYLWVEARPARHTQPIKNHETTEALLLKVRSFSEHYEMILANWRDLIRSKSKDVWLWGASSKGVTFALSVDPGASTLKGAIDINPNKTGHFMSMTGLPIVSPSALRNSATVIIMNPNYRREIEQQISKMGIFVEIVTGINSDDH